MLQVKKFQKQTGVELVHRGQLEGASDAADPT